MHPAVLKSISQVIKKCKAYNVEVSICGQAGSREEMVKFLIDQGIDSITVNADVAHKISKLIAEIESQKSFTEDIEITKMQEKKEESHHKNQQVHHLETPIIATKKNENTYEDIVLKELGDEYLPGELDSKERKEIPSLNDAIPVDSEHFNNSENEEVNLTEEWQGEKKD